MAQDSNDVSKVSILRYYRKNDVNIVDDNDAIKNCRAEQNRDIIDNGRLGSYDKVGTYTVAQEIKAELLKIPKVISEVKRADKYRNTSDVYTIKGNIPVYGDIVFKLTNNAKEAVFYLVENVYREAGNYLEIYEEPLEIVNQSLEHLDITRLFELFNVTEEETDLGQRWDELEIDNILTRKVYMSILSTKIKEIDQGNEEETFNKMIAELNTSGDYGKRIISAFEDRLSTRPEIEQMKGTKGYGRAMVEVLLGSINMVTSEEDKQDPIIKQAYNQVIIIRNDNFKQTLDEAKSKVDEKEVVDTVDEINSIIKGEEEEEKGQVSPRRRLDKPILKQGKGEEEEEEKDASSNPKSKEDKIKEILNKQKAKGKSGGAKKKKTSKKKKLKASKKKKKKVVLKAPKKAAAKKPAGAKKPAAKKKKKADINLRLFESHFKPIRDAIAARNKTELDYRANKYNLIVSKHNSVAPTPREITRYNAPAEKFNNNSLSIFIKASEKERMPYGLGMLGKDDFQKEQESVPKAPDNNATIVQNSPMAEHNFTSQSVPSPAPTPSIENIFVGQPASSEPVSIQTEPATQPIPTPEAIHAPEQPAPVEDFGGIN